jgi:hypothetical protein
MKTICRLSRDRTLFAVAGTVTIVSIVLGLTLSPWYLALAGFVALNQWLYAAAGECPASILLRRGCGPKGA